MHATLGDEMSEPPVAAISVRYAVRPVRDAWVLPEGPVPESTTHDAAVSRLTLLLEAWVQKSARNARVARNLAVRWMESAPGVGLDPDVCVIEPAPPEPHLRSLRTWQPGHVVPRICFEVVSESHPYKDYVSIQDRYAAMGTHELVVFDPLLAGPAVLGGPVALQLWRRDPAGTLERIHFGSGPAFCEALGAWLHASGRTLEIAEDQEGLHRWFTGEERERAEKERERVARQALERRVVELEEKLSRSGQ
jgi:Uma2 family endonuclease